jgi:hypothetical protein
MTNFTDYDDCPLLRGKTFSNEDPAFFKLLGCGLNRLRLIRKARSWFLDTPKLWVKPDDAPEDWKPTIDSELRGKYAEIKNAASYLESAYNNARAKAQAKLNGKGKAKVKERTKGGAPSKAAQATKRKSKALDKSGVGASTKKKKLEDGLALTVKTSKKEKKKKVVVDSSSSSSKEGNSSDDDEDDDEEALQVQAAESDADSGGSSD